MRRAASFSLVGALIIGFGLGTFLVMSRPTEELGDVQAAEIGSSSDFFSNITVAEDPVLQGCLPEVYQGSFFYLTAAKMLESLGVEVYKEDKVVVFPDPALGIGSQLKVYRAKPVLIKDEQEEILVRSWANTVGDLLTEQRIAIATKDIVKPDQQTPLLPNQGVVQVEITRVQESELVIDKAIDYQIQIIDDPELEKGVKKVTQNGSKGMLRSTYMVRRENGKEVSRVLMDRKVVKEPRAEIIHRGTKIITYGSGAASWYGGVPSLTAAHRTLPFGTRVRVVNVTNGKSVIVRIADRGPFIPGRIIDLSSDAFAQIGSLGSGVINVRLEKE